MLGYTYQNSIVLIGSRTGATITEAPLTANYTDNVSSAVAIGGMSKATLYVSYTMGSGETGNTIEIKVETSPDGSNFYQLVNEGATGGTSTLYSREFTKTGVDGGNDKFVLPLDVNDKWLRVSVKESGVATNYGTAFVEILLGGAK